MSSTVPMKIRTQIQDLIAIVTEPCSFLVPHMPGDWLVIRCITDQQLSHSKSKQFPKEHEGNLH